MKDPSGLKVDSASLMKHASEMNTSAVSQLKQSSEMNVDSASGVKSSGTAPGKHEMLPIDDESDYYPEEEESRLPEGPESPQLALSVSDKSDPMFKLESTKDQATSIKYCRQTSVYKTKPQLLSSMNITKSHLNVTVC